MTTFIRLTNTKPGVFLILGFLFTIVTILTTEVNAQVTPGDSGNFITTWRTDVDASNPTTSAANQIAIPTASGTYNYDVYWEDVTDPTVNGTVRGATGDLTITFPAIGTYRVEISGDFPRIYFNNGGDKRKIRSILQWGDIEWTSFFSAFYGCRFLTLSATDAPDLSNVTNLAGMFYNASNVHNNLNHWDVSNVTDMALMFRGADSFNGSLGGWDVSNVTRMQEMFFGARAFNRNISGWDVSNVTNMRGMFDSADAFNRNISSWDVSNVTNMSEMFAFADAFNQDISSWGVSNVTNMSSMFKTTGAFDQDLGDWNVSNVNNMDLMFDFSELSIENYDATLIGWAAQSVRSGVQLGASGLEYCDGADARQALIDPPKNWIITGDTRVRGCGEYITTWKTDNPGPSNDDEIFIPTAGSGYNYDVYWEKVGAPGVNGSRSGVAGHLLLTFPSAGTYRVYITGHFPGIHFNGGGDKEKILSIDQWGAIEWGFMEGSYLDASNLVINATDAPDLTNVTSLERMFWDASSMNSDLSHWDVSGITNMHIMLNGSGLSTENYDATLIGWAGQTVQSGVELGARGLEYCTGQTARQTLSNEFGWTITGDDPASGCDPSSVLLTGAPGFRMLSAPVEVTLADLLGPVWTQGASGGADYSGGDPNVWTWDNTAAGEDPAGWIPVTDLSATVSAGTGVLVYVFDEDDYGLPGSATWPKTLSVSGTVNSLPLSFSTEINSITGGWTLLGNPVNTGIDWNALTLTEVENTVYVWDPAAGDYIFWNGSSGDLTNGIIHPFQGFFVQTSAGASSPSLTIPSGATTSPEDFFGKEQTEEPFVVRLQIEGETGLESTAWLQFSGEGSLARNSTDAVKLQPLSADYAVLGLEVPSDKDPSLLALKHLPLDLDAPLEIPLTATAIQEGRFTLTTTDMNLPAGWSLSLQDTRTGTQIDLEEGESYSFELEADEQLHKIPLRQPTEGTEGGVQLTPRPLTQPSVLAKNDGTDDSAPRFLLTITPAGTIEADLPDQIALEQNYPNPFNPTTQISYQLPASSEVRLEVYDMVGRRVATLVDGQVGAGAHQVSFNAGNLSSGIYLYRLQTGSNILTKKLTLIK